MTAVSGNGYRLVVRFGHVHRVGLMPFVGAFGADILAGESGQDAA